MPYDTISSDPELAALCRDLAGAPNIAFDTEFVAEHSYRPQLCLVQVATDDRLAIIDPLSIRDMTPFWLLLASGDHETVVHAGREELLFCLAATGRPPVRLFDIQIAAGLVGLEYPAGYASLMLKLLGKRAQKGETRTDWRHRPLTERQLDYALDDVRYLLAMRDLLRAKLAQLQREAWLEIEMTTWQQDVAATRASERWWKVSGASGLSSRSMAIVRELWRWREREAERRDCPVKRVLRDDLIVELAKRRSADLKHIRTLRGLERGDLQRALPILGKAIERALALPDEECPSNFAQRELPPQVSMLGQFLSSALTSICRSANVAPSIVGTASDVRDLIAYRLGMAPAGDEPPVLAQSWRADVVGRLIEDLLSGTVAIRIRDPLSDEPLSFEPIAQAGKK